MKRPTTLVAPALVVLGAASVVIGVFLLVGLAWALIVAGAAAVAVGLLADLS